MNRIALEAKGKVNLGLDVLGRRADGYHLVKMVMQTVDLSDTVILEKRTHPGIAMRSSDDSLPVDDGNLCIRAAKLLFEKHSIAGGLFIDLTKRIPVAAGMAGGSTDAAAVLKGINELYELGLSVDELKGYGLSLGADIPFCIIGGTALSEGIGEVLTPISGMKHTPVLVAKPFASASTKAVYEALDSLESYDHPDIDGMVAAISAGDMDGMYRRMGNVLSLVTEPLVPEIGTIREVMMEAGALQAMMTGSGPTVFGLFDSKEAMDTAKEKIEGMHLCQGVYDSAISE